ncbi:integral membrane protein-like protein [Lophiostoma macrostomum CBS 122681]|uniref:Integral membrane protein-like protein n=1 Tax=Lophiostoma macrostomum CBS 122681 TaxID=1314788 RepID=A0A6A6SLK6_9PLEO|nr:integral membrane protein-like protein [Lophiostoma macrostomum CBS 122681]
MGFFNRRKSHASSSTASPTGPPPDLSKPQLKRATRNRKIWGLITSFFLFISVIFLILVEIGGTYNRSLIRDWYFIRLDLSHIIPASVPNFALINTIAQTLGLHDFYQVGLWGFCEGYVNQGVTYCSKPQTLYWFNPVEILGNELLAGASINLPSDITDILDLIKIVSQVMFGLFLTSACLSFVLIFIVPLSIYTRWLSLPIAILTFLNALFCTVATIVATVMFIIFRNVIGSVAQLNISADIGEKMFAFMWVASAFSIFAWLVQTGLCCCGASRRDVKTGRKRGNEKAYTGVDGAGNGIAPGTNGANGRGAEEERGGEDAEGEGEAGVVYGEVRPVKGWAAKTVR